MQNKHHRGFSLAEVLAALTIGAMILVAVLSIYRRAEASAAAITRKLDNSRLPAEILQRIAEDLDGIVAAGTDTKVTVEHKTDIHGFPTSRLTILKTYHDHENNPQTFEEIVWQSSYDFDSVVKGLVLYRRHRGIALEDKLLDEPKELWERELFVPICTGITLFDVQRKGQGDSLPTGIVVTISFAEAFKTPKGTWDVLEEEKKTRTIAIDRTRKIGFEIVKEEDKQKG